MRADDKSVPVVLQKEGFDCGAAALTMILRYFGRSIELASCSKLLKIGSNHGTSLLSIAETARLYGLEAKAYRISVLDIEFLELPSIVFWREKHFVVLEEYSEREVTIVDPAVGRQHLCADDFRRFFSNIAIIFRSRAAQAARSEKTMPP